MDARTLQARVDKLKVLLTEKLGQQFVEDLTNEQLSSLVSERLDNSEALALITANYLTKTPISLPMGTAVRLVAVFAGAGTSGTGGKELKDLVQAVEERQHALEERLQHALEEQLGWVRDVILTLFDYSEENVTASSAHDFKAGLLDGYSRRRQDKQGRDLAYCMLTHCYLPGSLVIGAHLWKRQWARFAHLIGIEINDTRNGLLLFKPIEWAFDTSRLSFYEIDGQPVAFLNDAAIHALPLLTKLKDLKQEVSAEELEAMGAALPCGPGMTFGQLEGRTLRSGTGTPPNPYTRVLYFQARRAKIKARAAGWEEPERGNVRLPAPGCRSPVQWLANVNRMFESMDQAGEADAGQAAAQQAAAQQAAAQQAAAQRAAAQQAATKPAATKIAATKPAAAQQAAAQRAAAQQAATKPAATKPAATKLAAAQQAAAQRAAAQQAATKPAATKPAATKPAAAQQAAAQQAATQEAAAQQAATQQAAAQRAAGQPAATKQAAAQQAAAQQAAAQQAAVGLTGQAVAAASTSLSWAAIAGRGGAGASGVAPSHAAGAAKRTQAAGAAKGTRK